MTTPSASRMIISISFWLLLEGCFSFALLSQQSTLSRKVLITLQPGESILESESCLPMEVDPGGLFLVTRAGGKFFIYEGNQRKGPYESLEHVELKVCQDLPAEEGCNIYTAEEAAPDPELLSISDDGQTLIRMGGKTYGPFAFLRELHVWPDKSGFIAIVMDAAMKSTLVNSEGQRIALEGEAGKIHISPQGKNFVFVVKENPGMDPDLMKRDFSKMTPEEIMKFAQEQEEKAKKAGPPKAWIYTGKGPRLGPFDPRELQSDNPAFTKTGGDHWMMTLDNALYIDGVMVKKFDDMNLNTCMIWLSKDGKRFAVGTYDRITFSDGSTYPYPVKTVSSNMGGKSVLKWITVEQETDLVLYSREL